MPPVFIDLGAAEENVKLVVSSCCSGAIWSDAGAHALKTLRELILNSSTDHKVITMGCGYGLMPIMLTTPLLEKWQREGDRVTVTFDFSAALIPLQSHGLLNYSLVLFLSFIMVPPQTHTHISFFILTH